MYKERETYNGKLTTSAVTAEQLLHQHGWLCFCNEMQQMRPTHLDICEHQLSRLLVQQHCHVGLLVGVSGDHQTLYQGGGCGGPDDGQLGLDGSRHPAVPWPSLLLLLRQQLGVHITTTCKPEVHVSLTH